MGWLLPMMPNSERLSLGTLLFALLETQSVAQQVAQYLRAAGFGDEFDGAQGARVPRIAFLVLAGQCDDFDAGRMRQQFGDEAKALFRAVRRRGQAQIDQRQLRRICHVAQQTNGLWAVFGEMNVEFVAQNEA